MQPVPYEAGINGGLRPGKRIYVTGTPKGDSFHVNLITNQGDIAIHFNPRFKEKVSFLKYSFIRSIYVLSLVRKPLRERLQRWVNN